jgi:hypothetical protein
MTIELRLSKAKIEMYYTNNRFYSGDNLGSFTLFSPAFLALIFPSHYEWIEWNKVSKSSFEKMVYSVNLLNCNYIDMCPLLFFKGIRSLQKFY